GVTLIQVIEVQDVAQQGEPDDEGEEGAADAEVWLALQAAPDQRPAGEGPLATADVCSVLLEMVGRDQILRRNGRRSTKHLHALTPSLSGRARHTALPTRWRRRG